MNVRFSRALAIVFGIALPVLGIVRNWTSPTGDVTGFFIDLAAGGWLVFGVWRTAENEHSGQRFLAAGWGMAFALYYTSTMRLIEGLSITAPVATPIPPEWSVAGSMVGMLVAIAGLLTSLRSIKKR
jgi:hypothetical protein